MQRGCLTGFAGEAGMGAVVLRFSWGGLLVCLARELCERDRGQTSEDTRERERREGQLSRHGASLGVGYVSDGFPSCKVPVRKTAKATMPIETVMRVSIFLGWIASILYLHLPFDLSCVLFALLAAEIKKPFPVTSTRKGFSQALYYYQRCQR